MFCKVLLTTCKLSEMGGIRLVKKLNLLFFSEPSDYNSVRIFGYKHLSLFEFLMKLAVIALRLLKFDLKGNISIVLEENFKKWLKLSLTKE